jgi:hypothetical protein
MKITKEQLKQIIKEEIMREYEYDAQEEIYAITQHLSDAAMKLAEFAYQLRGSDDRKSLQFDSMARQVEKIQDTVETHIKGVESGLQEGEPDYGVPKQDPDEMITLPASVVFAYTKETQQIEKLLADNPEALERLKGASNKFFDEVMKSKNLYEPEHGSYHGGRGGH